MRDTGTLGGALQDVFAAQKQRVSIGSGGFEGGSYPARREEGRMSCPVRDEHRRLRRQIRRDGLTFIGMSLVAWVAMALVIHGFLIVCGWAYDWILR